MTWYKALLVHIEDDCSKTHLYISLKHKDQLFHYGIPVLHGRIHDSQTNYGVSGLGIWYIYIFFKNEGTEPLTLRDFITYVAKDTIQALKKTLKLLATSTHHWILTDYQCLKLLRSGQCDIILYNKIVYIWNI